MPDRVIRDELLTSERYWSVSIEAQRLFVHLLLNADDVGRFSGKNYTIRSSCFPGQAVDPGKVEKMLTELHDADLVRIYECDSERFIFLPRFKQRLRFTKSRYPAPPLEISDIPKEKTVESPTQDGRKSDSRRQKRSEEKRSNTLRTLPGAFERFWATYPKRANKGQAEKAWRKLNPSETLIEEILQAIKRAETSEKWRKESGRFIPYPATWLNAQGWEDELEPEREQRFPI